MEQSLDKLLATTGFFMALSAMLAEQSPRLTRTAAHTHIQPVFLEEPLRASMWISTGHITGLCVAEMEPSRRSTLLEVRAHSLWQSIQTEKLRGGSLIRTLLATDSCATS